MNKFEINDGILTKAYVTNDINYVIPSQVTLISDSESELTSAFYDLRQKEFKLSFEKDSKLTRIGKYSFYRCSKLLSIDFSNAIYLNSIGGNAFGCCSSLTKLEFPSSLVSIGEYGTFADCNNLRTVTFPDRCSLVTLGSGTFYSTKITTFRVPYKCNYLCGETFANTPVEYFTVEEGNTKFVIYEGSVFNSDLTLLYACRKIGDIRLPEQMTSIDNLAFSGCRSNLVLGKNVTSVSSLPFLEYLGKFITIYGAINILASRSFQSCSNLIEVKFFNDIGTIEENSFRYCNSLRRILFISPVKSIVESAFPNIKRICFYGNIESIKQLLPNSNVKQCIILSHNRCKSKKSNGLITAMIILVYSNT